MRAMVFDGSQALLQQSNVPDPAPGPSQILIEVEACGVCRTDLHIVDGDLDRPVLPLIPGHEIVARIARLGRDVTGFETGQRVGVPWLGRTCESCAYCRSGRENLCDAPEFTGYTLNGGYAQMCVAEAQYVFRLPEDRPAAELAPLMCAGLIGHRSFRLIGPVRRLGIYGFGAAAHILCQIARHQRVEIHAFTRDGDRAAQDFARGLGAAWAGGSSDAPPVELDGAIIFAPVGALVPAALRVIAKGGRVVCGGIHMSDIPAFPYSILWEERSILSVANLTRADGEDFFPLAEAAGVRTDVTVYPLAEANAALDDLRQGRLQGAAVLAP